MPRKTAKTCAHCGKSVAQGATVIKNMCKCGTAKRSKSPIAKSATKPKARKTLRKGPQENINIPPGSGTSDGGPFNPESMEFLTPEAKDKLFFDTAAEMEVARPRDKGFWNVLGATMDAVKVPENVQDKVGETLWGHKGRAVGGATVSQTPAMSVKTPGYNAYRMATNPYGVSWNQTSQNVNPDRAPKSRTQTIGNKTTTMPLPGQRAAFKGAKSTMKKGATKKSSKKMTKGGTYTPAIPSGSQTPQRDAEAWAQSAPMMEQVSAKKPMVVEQKPSGAIMGRATSATPYKLRGSSAMKVSKRGSIKKSASDVGAVKPSTSKYEFGSYKAGKTQADGFGRKAIGHISPKQTDTYSKTPSQGFKSVTVSNLEIGGYKRKK